MMRTSVRDATGRTTARVMSRVWRKLLVAVLLCVLCDVPFSCNGRTFLAPKTCEAFTEDRNLGNFLEVFVSDLGGLVRGEGLLEGWVSIVERGEPIMWAVILVGGSVALKVMPTRTLRKYIRPMPLFPPSVANPADAAKLKAFLKAVDKSVSKGATLLERIKGLFMH